MKSGLFNFMILLLFWGCSKDKNNQLLGPGIILSTDVPPPMWYDLRDYLKANGVKLTFYTQSYHVMDSAGKAQTRLLIADGHELAHHTTAHLHADAFLSSHTIDEYMQQEIYNMDELMQKDGFTTTTFAYPYGDFTNKSDEYLLKRFKNIRKIISPYAYRKIEDTDQIYYRYKGVRIFYACSIDKKENYPVEEVLKALDKAKSSRSAVSMYCHVINRGEPELNTVYSLSFADLDRIIQHANKLGLKYYRACDLTQ